MSTGAKTRLLNRQQVKAFVLSEAGKRHHRFTRVGADFYIRCEAHLREFIRWHVKQLPSRGKTIN
jgi:hypothetical protein